MATTYTLTGDAGNLLGEVPEPRRLKVWMEANVDAIVDATGNEIRLGDVAADVADDGTFTFASAPATNDPGTNPTDFQLRVTIEYPHARPGGGRGKWSSGWFSLTADTDLADVVAEQYVPPTYMTTAVQTLDGYVTEAETARTGAQTAQAGAEAARDATVDISGISTSDDVVEALVKNTGGAGPKTSAALSATIAPPVTGEAAVVNANYQVGDIRRYGVMPGDTTTSATTLGNRVIAAINANALLDIATYFPAGYYNCGLNVNVSDAKVRLDPGAEFGGIIHVGSNTSTDITDVTITGPLVTYDRFGVYKVDGFRFDTALCKSDGAKNVPNPGSRGRGCHFYNGAKNVVGRAVIVEDMDAASPSADAAIAIDGTGNNPSNLDVGTLHVLKSDVHGVYLTGRGHKFGLVKVDEWGAGSYAGVGLQDAAVAQSSELKGFWSNRCNESRIDRLVVNQGAGTRTNALYDVMVDETTATTAPITGGGISFGSIEVLNVVGASRGVAFGDASSARSYAQFPLAVEIETLRVNVSASRPNIAGYAAVNAADGADVVVSGAVRVFSATLLNDVLQTASGTRFRASLVDAGTHRAGIVKAAGVVELGKVVGHKDGHVSGTTAIDVAATAATSSFGDLVITTSAAHAARAILLAAPDVKFGRVTIGQLATSGGVVALAGGAHRTRFDRLDLTGSGASGVGLYFGGTSSDLYFGSGTITGFATGVSRVAGTIGGIAVGMVVSGNTTNTNVAAATFTELGSSGFQL